MSGFTRPYESVGFSVYAAHPARHNRRGFLMQKNPATPASARGCGPTVKESNMTNRTRAPRGHKFWKPDATTARQERINALREVNRDGAVIYAVRARNGFIKIGYTADLARRSKELGTTILGFRYGTRADELEIHHHLAAHAAKGREFYHETPEVLSVVNDMRGVLGLEPLAVRDPDGHE